MPFTAVTIHVGASPSNAITAPIFAFRSLCDSPHVQSPRGPSPPILRISFSFDSLRIPFAAHQSWSTRFHCSSNHRPTRPCRVTATHSLLLATTPIRHRSHLTALRRSPPLLIIALLRPAMPPSPFTAVPRLTDRRFSPPRIAIAVPCHAERRPSLAKRPRATEKFPYLSCATETVRARPRSPTTPQPAPCPCHSGTGS